MTLLEWPKHSHDPGGRVRLPVSETVTSDAEFSSCGRYRSLLKRTWNSQLPSIMFVGMNPSVADLEVDDPTVRKECGYAERWGYGGLVKTNVMDYRATSPKDLLKEGVIPCSAANLKTIAQQLKSVRNVVVAWGRLPQSLRCHSDAVSQLLSSFDGNVWCLGHNQDLSPKHPLYLKNSAPLVPYQL